MTATANVFHFGIDRFRGLVEVRDPWVDVRDFGARGDGVADDTEAIRRAADFAARNGRTLYFPNGTYNINGQIRFPPSTLQDIWTDPIYVIRGEGPGTKIVLTGFAGITAPDAVFRFDSSGAIVYVSDMFISSDGVIVAQNGIHLFHIPGSSPWLVLTDVGLYIDYAGGEVSAVLYANPGAAAMWFPALRIVGTKESNTLSYVQWPRLLHVNGTSGGNKVPSVGLINVSIVTDATLITDTAGAATCMFTAVNCDLGSIAIRPRFVSPIAACWISDSLVSNLTVLGNGIALIANTNVRGTLTPGDSTVVDGWLVARTTWDPPALNTGQYATVFVPMPNTAGVLIGVGKTARAAFSQQLPGGCMLTADVVVSGGVTGVRATLWNFSGTTVDLPSGVLTVYVKVI